MFLSLKIPSVEGDEGLRSLHRSDSGQRSAGVVVSHSTPQLCKDHFRRTGSRYSKKRCDSLAGTAVSAAVVTARRAIGIRLSQ